MIAECQCLTHLCVIVASVGDFVWRDLNGDGVQDGNETGIGNVLLELLDSTGAVVKTTQTDSLGLYVFTSLLDGNYSVRVMRPDNMVQTYELDGTRDEVTAFALTAGQVKRDVDFGFQRKYRDTCDTARTVADTTVCSACLGWRSSVGGQQR